MEALQRIRALLEAKRGTAAMDLCGGAALVEGSIEATAINYIRSVEYVRGLEEAIYLIAEEIKASGEQVIE